MTITPKIDRFLDQFVTGSLVFVGTWYLHRGFLQKYFPNLAALHSGDSRNQLEIELALAMFVVGSICAGVMMSHLTDMATVALFNDDAESEKADRRYRRWFRRFARVFTLWPAPDPRVHIVRRYLRSPRRGEILDLLRVWALTDAELLKSPGEIVLAHQHMVVHLRTYSDRTRTALEELYAPVTFAGSMFVALCSLVLISLMSFLTAPLVESTVRVQYDAVKVAVTAGLYIAAVVTGFSFRRRFRDFCGTVVTTALHFHLADNVNGPPNRRLNPTAEDLQSGRGLAAAR